MICFFFKITIRYDLNASCICMSCANFDRIDTKWWIQNDETPLFPVTVQLPLIYHSVKIPASWKVKLYPNRWNTFPLGCPRGVFGDSCLNNCSVRCKVPLECDRVTGRCFGGCQAGWGDPTCSTSTILLLLFYWDIDQNN